MFPVLVLSCLVLSCLVLSCPVLSCQAKPCQLSCFSPTGKYFCCCFVLFFIYQNKAHSPAQLSPHLIHSPNPDRTNWLERTQQRMGIFLFPSPNSWGSVRDQMVQIIQRVSLCQRGADIQDFACDFLAVINDLDYQDNNDLKEVFNSCLDEPLSPWEMVRLGTLTFWEFVYQIYHHGGHECLWGLEEPLWYTTHHNPSPPRTRKRRRRKNGPTSSATSTEEDTAPRGSQ